MTYFNEFGQARLGWNVGTPSSGGGSTVDTDAQAFITAASITDTTQQSAINTLVTQLKTYGIWTKLKAVYPFVGGTASSHKFNLKDPRDLDEAFRLVFNGGWTHSSTGALPNGTNAFADTKLIPSSNFNTTTFNHLSYYSRSNTAKTNFHYDMGSFNGSSITSMIIRRSTNISEFYADYPSGTSYRGASTTNLNGQGFYLGSQTGANTKYYKNNSVIASNSDTTLNLNQSTYPIFIGTLGESTYATANRWSNKECAFSSIGDGLTDTEAANFYTAVQTFQTTLGRHVGVPIVADSDAQAFLNAAVITNQTQANAINTLVTSLKSANIWTKMKAIYPFVGGTASSHKFNLKDPRDLDAAYRLVFNGGWTHSSTGALPNGTTAYASLGSLNMNTISPSDYSLGLYSRTNGGNSNWYDFGATNNVDTGWFILNTRNAANNIDFQAGSVNKNISNTNSQGFYQAGATSNNLTKIWKNGVVIGTNSTTQTKTPFNQIFEIGRGTITTGGGYYSNREQGLFYISTGLTDAEIVSVRTAVYNYQNALGRLAE